MAAGQLPPHFLSQGTLRTNSFVSVTLSLTDRRPISRLRCAIPQSEPVRIQSFPAFVIRAHTFHRTKHCWQNYVDYHKCILAKGEDFAPCRQVHYFSLCVQVRQLIFALQFFLAYRSLCPSAWCERWDDQRGTTEPFRTLHGF